MIQKQKRAVLALVMITVALAAVACGPDKPPSREHFPIIKQNVYLVQQAIKERDLAALDTLVTPNFRSDEKMMDSLFAFVYGSDDSFAFEQFGDYEIIHTDKKARVDCFLMDSTAQHDRPAVLTFENKKGKWLLKGFAEGELKPDEDSAGLVP